MHTLGMVDERCIAAILATVEVAATVQPLVAETGNASRTQVACRICREPGFPDSRGVLQLASCKKAMRSLHEFGRIQLPAALAGPGGARAPSGTASARYCTGCGRPRSRPWIRPDLSGTLRLPFLIDLNCP